MFFRDPSSLCCPAEMAFSLAITRETRNEWASESLEVGVEWEAGDVEEHPEGGVAADGEHELDQRGVVAIRGERGPRVVVDVAEVSTSPALGLVDRCPGGPGLL